MAEKEHYAISGEYVIRDVPVICAECPDTGKPMRLPDGNHLTCHLRNDRLIYGSKPTWCPKGPLFVEKKKYAEFLKRNI